MKILRLDLRAFGPFSEVSLDLSAGEQGFHLIYGPNEAGKSSALRALRNLLYGIPGNTKDDFLHNKPNLRIAAALVRRDGERLEIVRRKGTKGTLLTPDEKESLDEAQLHNFLGGCDQAQFETMFGIDHAGLIAGGQDIVCGRGEIGHVLFAAGAGLSGLRTIRNNLEKQAEELFKPGGSKPAVNQALSELNKLRKLVGEKSLRTSEWQARKTALEEATKQLAEVENELAKLLREKARLQRLAGALPAIGRWKQAVEQLAAQGDVPCLPPDFGENRRDAILRLETERRAEREAQMEMTRLDGQIAALNVPEGLVSRATEIEDSYQELSVHRKAQNDLPGLVARREHFEQEAARLLRELRPDLTLANAEQLRFSSRQRLEIQNLGNQQGALEKQLSQARSAIAEAKERTVEIAEQLEHLPEARDSGALTEAVRAARLQGNLTKQAADLRAELASANAQAKIDLTRLGLWSGSLDALETLAVPSSDTMARIDRTLTDAQSRVARSAEQLEQARGEAAHVDRQLEQLRLEGEVPTETDLDAARKQRDEIWQSVVKDWRGPSASSAESRDDLAAAYERAVRKADDLADRLRREANRVASRATLQSHRTSLQQQIADLARQHERETTQLRQSETEWRELWQPVAIVPLPPREMQTWVQRQQALTQKVQFIRQRTVELANLDEQIDEHRRKLQACLDEPCGETGFSPSLDALLARADVLLDEIKAAADERRQLDKEKARLAKTSAQAETKLQQAQNDLAQWQVRWSAAIEPLGLPAETSPLIVNSVVAQAVELSERLTEAASYAERIQGIGHDAARYRRSSEQLLAAVDPDRPPPGERWEQAVEDLAARLRKALADQNSLELLRSQRQKVETKQKQAREKADAMDARLAALCREARCASVEELPAIEAAAAEAQRVRRERDAAQTQLLELAAGATVDQLIAEAATVSADSLPGDIRRLDAAVAELEQTRDRLNQAKGGEAALLAGMDATAAAAEAAEDAQGILAGLEADAQHYLRLRLASAVLREGIERYRKKNEGSVLSRASELFRRLTLGSFAGLRIGFDDDRDEQALEGIRPDGGAVLPAAMSEGTCDQLYLALRLASLETWLDRNEPLPLIVDDILVTFDNARAAATLEVLAEVSARTQIIFFAHHEHLVHLARRCLPANVLFEHYLRTVAVE